ncbi:MAG: DNA mismatch repair endonuclease MutL, partial [Polyangiaceae bacterium]|nr:DNA mismatch repair endonuclease MutL [Polyangiaceae bacterium]
RRKFLRSTNTEASHISNAFVDAALSRPEVGFQLHRDGRQIKNFPPASSRRRRVEQVLAEQDLIVCEGSRGPLEMMGYLCPLERARVGAAGLKIIVNGRPIRDRALASTVAHAYGAVLERGKYPRGVLYLDLPGELVDINVHPQKSEVRFADSRAVADALHRIISQSTKFARNSTTKSNGASSNKEPQEAPPSVTAADRPSSLLSSADQAVEEQAAVATERSSTHFDSALTLNPTASERQGQVIVLKDGKAPPSGHRYAWQPAATTPEPSSGAPSKKEEQFTRATRDEEAYDNRGFKGLRFIKQLKKKYLLCEGSDGLSILDQQAVAEQVLRSQLQSAYAKQQRSHQSLLFPLSLALDVLERKTLERHGEFLQHLGLIIELSEEQALLRAIPKNLQKADPQRLVNLLLDELQPIASEELPGALPRIFEALASFGATRAGESVSPEEARSLLQELNQGDFHLNTPSRRTVISFTSWLELERRIGRR